jgi:hypothetical protein
VPTLTCILSSEPTTGNDEDQSCPIFNVVVCGGPTFSRPHVFRAPVVISRLLIAKEQCLGRFVARRRPCRQRRRLEWSVFSTPRRRRPHCREETTCAVRQPATRRYAWLPYQTPQWHRQTILERTPSAPKADAKYTTLVPFGPLLHSASVSRWYDIVLLMSQRSNRARSPPCSNQGS